MGTTARPAMTAAAFLALGAVGVLTACGTTAAGPSTTSPAQSSTDAASTRRPGDPAVENPNHVDNNAWKQRLEPSPTDRAAAEKLAKRVLPVLQRARAEGGDISPSAVKAVFVGFGVPASSAQVEPLRPAAAATSTTPPAGAAFGVRVGALGCVVGDVTGDRVRGDVAGAAAEFGCLEPFSH